DSTYGGAISRAIPRPTVQAAAADARTNPRPIAYAGKQRCAHGGAGRRAALRTRWCWPASGVAHTVVLAGERRCTRGGAGRSDAPHDGVGRCSAPKQPAEALMPLNEAMNLPRWPEPQ